MSIFVIIGGYVTSFFGFSLGKATLEEHHEIKTKALFLSYLLQLFAIVCLIITKEVEYIGLGILSFVLLCIGYFKYHSILEFNAVILYSILFSIYFKTDYFFLVIFPLVSLIIENSFKKFHKKEEIYKLVIVCILGILLL